MYTDLLTKIKNAQAVKKENIKVFYSKMTEAIVDVLVRNGYLESCERRGRGAKRVLDIKLKYENGADAFRGVKFISKPSRRIYAGYQDLKSVRHGYGLAILSTQKGIMTNKEARKHKVGGEVLFEVW